MCVCIGIIFLLPSIFLYSIKTFANENLQCMLLEFLKNIFSQFYYGNIVEYK